MNAFIDDGAGRSTEIYRTAIELRSGQLEERCCIFPR